MKRKITLLALGAKCGALGESGLAVLGESPAARALLEKRPSRESRSTNPSAVKPAPASQRNSRRVRPQNVLEGQDAPGCSWLMARTPSDESIHEQKLIDV